MSITWDHLFLHHQSERESRLGNLTVKYNIPKYFDLFSKSFINTKNLSFLEVGAGGGEITRYILQKKPAFLRSIAVTEFMKTGVALLRKRGIPARQMDAEHLTHKDNSFDVVCAFDVMHHVQNPDKMAHEMTRVANKYVFLIEANGLSAIRKLLERTSWYKKLGEHSYFPWQYASFFDQKKFSSFTIRPFLFSPPGVPDIFIAPVISFSELLERIPLLRWQCSGVVIVGKKI